MKVLIVGSGGREHAIAWSVAKSPKVDKIYCAPGNAGIAEFAECVNIGAMEFDKLVAFAKENAIDLTIIGMDDPLVGGVVDAFESEGLRVFGPRKNARTDTSLPVINSSITISFPASPNCLSSINVLTPSLASSNVLQINTPFPSANPSAFNTIGILAVSKYLIASSGSVKFSYAAVGILYFFIRSLENAYKATEWIDFANKYKRNDIGKAIDEA